MVTLDGLLSRQSALLGIHRDGIVFPDYAGYSLANLPDSICGWLGIEPIEGQGLDDSYPFCDEVFEKVIVILMDGLGWFRLKNWMKQDPYADFSFWNDLSDQKNLLPITSIAPSTTCAALTTLNTGKSPASHGNIAYELWLKEFGAVYNMILQSPMPYRVDNDDPINNCFKQHNFLPGKTIDVHINRQGGSVIALHPAGIAHSSLTGMLFPLARREGYHSMGDLFYRIRQFVQTETSCPLYLYAYWSEIDELSHVYGPDDPRVWLALRDFSRYLRDLQDELLKFSSGRTLLLVTADHGFQFTPVHDEYDLLRHPEFLEQLVIRPTGENRLPFLHIKEGCKDTALDYINRTWPGKFQVFEGKEALASGLMGHTDIYSMTPNRIGDMVVVPFDDAYWWWSNRENRLIGRHGGLSSHEMLVPLAFISF